jgi:lactate dehydrogenase-like 2-hydroxyacid dehydrogenase
MIHKIVFLDADSVGQVEDLKLLNELGEYRQFGLTSPDQRIVRISGCDIVITNKVVIDKVVMDACPSLRLICIAATGMNNVELDYAGKKGITVKNVAGYSTESVAQSAFSMLFYLLHSSRYYDDYVKTGDYSKSPVFTHHGRSFYELKGKVIGIIGLGTIGKRVAQIASVFGMQVSYYSTSGKNINKAYPRLALEELLSQSDIVTIHCPLNGKTENLIGIQELKSMKRTAYLLNLGRGGIVNEKALAEALDSELIAGAGIDVLTREPITGDNPLLHCQKPEKIFITPHIAWASIESRKLLVKEIIDNIRSFLA